MNEYLDSIRNEHIITDVNITVPTNTYQCPHCFNIFCTIIPPIFCPNCGKELYKYDVYDIDYNQRQTSTGGKT